MPIVNRIVEFHSEITEWRRDREALDEAGSVQAPTPPCFVVSAVTAP